MRDVHDLETSKQASGCGTARLDKRGGEARARWKEDQLTSRVASGRSGSDAATAELEVAWSRVVDSGGADDLLNALPAFRKVVAERAASRKSGFYGLHEARPDRSGESRCQDSGRGDCFIRTLQGFPAPVPTAWLVKPPDGSKPFIRDEALIDPWGLPYQYDPTGRKNEGMSIDVWSIGPDASDRKRPHRQLAC